MCVWKAFSTQHTEHIISIQYQLLFIQHVFTEHLLGASSERMKNQSSRNVRGVGAGVGGNTGSVTVRSVRWWEVLGRRAKQDGGRE